MTRQTSIEAYDQIQNEGLLSPLRLTVYRALFRHGPCTANELVSKMKGDGKSTKSRDYFAQRLSELRDSGCVVEVGHKSCEITGRTAIIWDVTSNLPKPVIKTTLSARSLLIRVKKEISSAFLGAELSQAIDTFLDGEN